MNKQIESSIEGSSSNEFALFNNGITIISDETSVSTNTAKRDAAQVVLHNPQLVNGGQTAYTLSRIYEKCLERDDFYVFKGKEVLLRVITFVGSPKANQQSNRMELIGEISKASNSQTKIDESDRRSNDEIQINLQNLFFEKHGLYYERKRGEFSDGLHSEYLEPDLLIKRERLIRVILAGDYRVNQARSNVAQFFESTTLPSLIKLGDVDKYSYGYEILYLLSNERRIKPKVAGDRYRTKEFGQALRYGQYAVVAVCMNLGMRTRKPEPEMVKKILTQWQRFEKWAQESDSNSLYREDSSFDFVNYYKGATVNLDLKKYRFLT